MVDDQLIEDLRDLTGTEFSGVFEPVSRQDTVLLTFEEDDGTEHSVEAFVVSVGEQGGEISIDDPDVQQALESLQKEDIEQLPDEVQEKIRSALD